MQSKVQKTVIIGANSIAKALAKALRLFIKIEHINMSVLNDCCRLSVNPYKKSIQPAQVVVIVHDTQTTPQSLISWVHRLREEIKFSKKIIIFTSNESKIERLENTSLFFETEGNLLNYPLKSVKGHQVLGPTAPLSTFVTANYTTVRVLHGLWTDMKARGGALSKAEVIIRASSRKNFDIQDANCLNELRDLFLKPETISLVNSIIPHNRDNKAMMESLYRDLRVCNVETKAGCCRLFEISKAILETLPWKM